MMCSLVAITPKHDDNNRAVRQMLIQRGIAPENLPPTEDVKKVEHRLASDEKKALKKKQRKQNNRAGKCEVKVSCFSTTKRKI